MPAPPQPPPESLSGLIERVTFFNEENGFAVLKVKVKGHRDEVSVVGEEAHFHLLVTSMRKSCGEV